MNSNRRVFVMEGTFPDAAAHIASFKQEVLRTPFRLSRQYFEYYNTVDSRYLELAYPE